MNILFFSCENPALKNYLAFAGGQICIIPRAAIRQYIGHPSPKHTTHGMDKALAMTPFNK